MKISFISLIFAFILPVTQAAVVTYELTPDQETQNATITGTDVDVSASLLTLEGTGGYDASGNGWGITGTSDTDASNTDSGEN